LDEIRERGDRAADDEIVYRLVLLTALLLGRSVLQAKAVDHALHGRDLLANAIDAVDTASGEKDGERDPRKTAPRAHVHDAAAGREGMHLGDAERMQDVPFVQVLEVLAGNEVDALVPMRVQLPEGLETGPLLRGKPREVTVDQLQAF